LATIFVFPPDLQHKETKKEDFLQCLVLFVPTFRISPPCLHLLSVWSDGKSDKTIMIIADFEIFEKTAKALLKVLPKKTYLVCVARTMSRIWFFNLQHCFRGNLLCRNGVSAIIDIFVNRVRMCHDSCHISYDSKNIRSDISGASGLSLMP
jgi:hypothetical protein